MNFHLPELHYNLGHLLHSQGDLLGAAVAYRQSLSFDPNFVMARHSLAVVLAEQGRTQAAIQQYRQVIALEPEAVKAYNNLGCLLAEQGQTEAALDIYRRGMALAPAAAMLHSNFGKVLELQNPVAAMAAYRRAIELQPDFLAAHYHLANALQRQGQWAMAIEGFEQLLRLDPAHLSAQTGCGLAHAALGNWDRALEHFWSALQPQQEQITAFCTWADGLRGEDALCLARKACSRFLQTLLGQPACASQPTAARLAPASVTGRAVTGRSGSVETLTPSIAPKNPRQNHTVPYTVPSGLTEAALAQTYRHLGDLLMQYGGVKQQQQAELYYQQALQLQPHGLDLYLKLGNCLQQQQRWNAAVLLYRFALTLHPETASIYQQLGQLLEQQQRWTEAIACYRQALQATGAEFSQLPSPDSSPLPAPPLQRDLLQQDLGSTTSHQLAGVAPSTQTWIQQNPSSQYIALLLNAFQQDIQDSGTVASPDLGIGLGDQPVQHQPDSTGERLACRGSSYKRSSYERSNCEGLNCQRCLKQIVQQFAPLHLGRGIYVCQPEADQPEADQPEAAQPKACPPQIHLSRTEAAPLPYFVAEIPQAQAWMTPHQNDWMVTRSVTIATPDRLLLADVSRQYPGQLPGCSHAPAVDAFLSDTVPPDPTRPIEPVTGRIAALSSLSGHNYFHWMVDILPRFELLRQAGYDLTYLDGFWINDPRQPFQQATLHQLGIPPEKILAGDQHPQIQAERLVVPSFAGHLGWIEPWAVRFLRQQFLGLAHPTLPRPQRIYISRAKAHHRRVLNEPAVLEYLESQGFVSIELESLSFAEQIALFCHAQIIVAPHGGGLTNLLFCQPGTQVIELFAPQYIRHYYWVISQHLKLRHAFLMGEEITCGPIRQLMYPNPLMEDIWINLTALKTALQILPDWRG